MQVENDRSNLPIILVCKQKAMMIIDPFSKMQKIKIYIYYYMLLSLRRVFQEAVLRLAQEC